jgi:hypothetical protein
MGSIFPSIDFPHPLFSSVQPSDHAKPITEAQIKNGTQIGVPSCTEVAAKLIAVTRRRSLAANVLGGQRSRRKNLSGGRATETLSKRTDFNSAMIVLVSVVPGLSRGNSPGDTERDSGNGNQHLLPVHGILLR